MKKITTALQSIKAKAAAEAALLVTADGLVLEGVSDSEADLEAIAAYAASYVSASERLGIDVRFGKTQSVIVLYRGKALLIAPLHGPIMIVVVGSGSAQLGNLRLQVSRGLAEVIAAVADELPEMAPARTGDALPAPPTEREQPPATQATVPLPLTAAPTTASKGEQGKRKRHEVAHEPQEAPPSASREAPPVDDGPSKESDNFVRGIEEELARASQHEAEFAVALLMLEGAEETSSATGSKFRDDLIRLFANRLKKALRAVDMAARLTDGTFGVLLAGVKIDQARAIVQRITAQTLEDNLRQPRSEGIIRLRTGIATFPDAGRSAATLIQRATAALFMGCIEAALSHAQEHPGEFSVGVIALDMPPDAGTPAPRDAHEQPAARLARRLQKTLRATDMAAALDDAKVGVLLAGVNGDQAKAIIRRIVGHAMADNLGFPRSLADHLRAGIATYLGTDTSAAALVQQAEAAFERIPA